MERMAAFFCLGSMCSTMIVSLRWPLTSSLPAWAAGVAGEPFPAVGADQEHVHDRLGVLGQPVDVDPPDLAQPPFQVDHAAGDQQVGHGQRHDASDDRLPAPPPLAPHPLPLLALFGRQRRPARA